MWHRLTAMFALILLALFVLTGVAAVTGHVVDTRDPRFGIGPLLRPVPPRRRTRR